MDSLSLWEVSISLSVVRERRAISSPFHTRKTFPSIHSSLLTSMETIQPSTLTSPHLPYRQRRRSRARGKATGSLNHLFYSKRRGSASHAPLNTSQLPISKLWHLHMLPWISWYTFSGGINLSTSIGLFKCSENLSEARCSPNQSQRRGNWLGWQSLKWYLRRSRSVCRPESRRVPRFGANSTASDSGVANIVLEVGVCFGMIHCIAWAFSFPTHAELLIWRISSVAITTVPTYFFLTIGSNSWLSNMHSKTVGIVIVAGIIYFTILLAFIVYIIARAVTLILAFTSLRGLPPGAFDTVHRTTFISHV